MRVNRGSERTCRDASASSYERLCNCGRIQDYYFGRGSFGAAVGGYYAQMVEDKLRVHSDYYLGKVEAVIYSVLALLLSVTVLAAIASAGKLLWDALSH